MEQKEKCYAVSERFERVATRHGTKRSLKVTSQNYLCLGRFFSEFEGPFWSPVPQDENPSCNATEWETGKRRQVSL